MKGENVIVRSLGDQPLVRKVWEVTREKVYVCSEEGFVQIQEKGYQDDCFPIGFPRQDVFCYNERDFENLEKNHKKNPSAWNGLTVWNGDTNGNGKGKAT